MKYAYTILYVPDVSETVEFYKQAFGFSEKFSTPEKDYAEMVSGETTIAFASQELGEANFPSGFKKSSANDIPFGVELAFVTEDIENDFKKAVDAGVSIVTEITEKPWGQKISYVRDNNGFLIEICTPVQQ
jgi:uncharacterized glyoxalase superfamily protein PhnB